MADFHVADSMGLRPDGEVAEAIRHACEPLPSLGRAEEFGAAFDRFGGARIILLGEATHGSSEFYRARAAITRRLIEQHGFTIVAVEADWPDADRIDRHLRWRAHGGYDEEFFARFPTWMWRNVEVADFVEWLRAHNEDLPMDRRIEFRGLDIYSLRSSIAAVLSYLDRVNPAAAVVARQRYGCLTPWQADPAWYGDVVLRGEKDPCEDAVVAQLQDLLDQRLKYQARDNEEYFNTVQNARIIHAAERYYRIMYRSSTESWNLRDRHMFDTLRHVIAARGPGAKAVVWAHNSHIGNAAATATGWQGEFNIGELCQIAYGDNVRLIGMGTNWGTVAAADDWDGPMRIKEVLPSRPEFL